MEKKNTVWNIPNILSLLRCVFVPLFVWAILRFADASAPLYRLIPAAIFALTGLTDMLDGKIARKYDMVTTFGKFLDPLADKFMIFSALLVICVAYTNITPFFLWVAVLIMFRELGVTSLRLVVSGSRGIVVAASILGKAKTVSQMIGLVLVILEPLLIPSLYQNGVYLLSYIAAAVMTVTTVVSGVDYLKAYWPIVSGKTE